MEHWERFGADKGQAGVSVPEAGIMLTVIGRVRSHYPQVILNRLDTKPWEVLEISVLGDLKGVGDKYSSLMYRWEGAYSRVFDAQFFAPSLK